MKKNVSKIVVSMFTLFLVITIIGSINVRAVEPSDQTIEVQGDSIQAQVQNNTRTTFRFLERTRLTVCANIGLELDVKCEALRIGNKDVLIEVEGDADLRMTMTCTREENQLGLMNGSLHRIKNRNTYRYLEGFCIKMENSANCYCKCNCDPDCMCICDCECKCDPDCACICDCECKCESECSCVCDCPCECDPICTCKCNCQCNCDPECKCNSECPYNGAFLKARLRIRETNQNRLGQWAYYDYENKEWVTVTTTNQDGYLLTETNVLSTWTILVPEETTSEIFGMVTIISVFVIGILGISVFYFKRRH
ncbi:MAG: hypothetical protein ACFE8B_16830 [Candidatus Hermodarchaeota archaeon]